MASPQHSENITRSTGTFISATNEFDARMACIARLETFAKCPTDMFIHVKPADLAAAGFVYVQRDDIVRCNHCGVEIKDWKEGDLPTEVHRNRSKDCQFLQENYLVSEGNGITSVSVSLVAEGQETASSSEDGATARIKKLQTENKKLQDELTCKECKVEKIQTLFLPCRHLVVCEHCAERLDNCCLCQGKILGTVRVVMVPKLQ